METQYSEINQNEILSENKKHAIRAGKTNDILFVIAFIVSLIFIGLSVWLFCNNNIYKGDKEWVIKHLAQNREECKTMGDNARKLILQKFTKAYGTSRYVEIIKSLSSYGRIG